MQPGRDYASGGACQQSSPVRRHEGDEPDLPGDERMSKKNELADMLALMLVRSGKAESRAMPCYRYGDPAKHVEFESEIRRREEVKNAKTGKGK